MRGDDVSGQAFERGLRPVSGDGSGRLRREFERGNHSIHFKIPGSASLDKGFAAATTLVNTVLFEYTNRGRLFQCNLADGLCGGCHDDLLGSHIRTATTLDAATLVTQHKDKWSGFWIETLVQEFLQHNSIIVLRIMRAVDQRDVAETGSFRDGKPRSWTFL
jgi:hypothetical protein